MVFFFYLLLQERWLVAKNRTHKGRTSFQKLLSLIQLVRAAAAAAKELTLKKTCSQTLPNLP
jgi:hypothetical protein